MGTVKSGIDAASLSNSAAIETVSPRDGWLPIKTAPYGTPVVVLTERGQIFKAQRDCIDDCPTWRTCEEWDVCPPCWSDGVCWGSNEDDEPSDPPEFWMPLPQPPTRTRSVAEEPCSEGVNQE